MLILPIKKKWFDMITSGEKKEEYREIKLYWIKRIDNAFIKRESEGVYLPAQCLCVIFKNGYSKNARQLKCKVKVRIGTGKEEWGAEVGKQYYILDILEIMEGE